MQVVRSPARHSGLRIWRDRSCSLGRNHSSDLIPGRGTPCAERQPKKKEKTNHTHSLKRQRKTRIKIMKAGHLRRPPLSGFLPPACTLRSCTSSSPSGLLGGLLCPHHTGTRAAPSPPDPSACPRPPRLQSGHTDVLLGPSFPAALAQIGLSPRNQSGEKMPPFRSWPQMPSASE